MPQPPQVHTVALLGNHLPRRCGLATFTTDLALALNRARPEVQSWVLAMNDCPEGYSYDDQVRYEIQQNCIDQYRHAAQFLTQSSADILCLQHEYGIFGGPAGSYVLELLDSVQLPVVTTLHTVLREPDADQFRVMQALISRSDRLVVMSSRAMSLLTDIYHARPEKIELIAHGIPDVPFMDPNYFKEELDVEGRTVILTFGLLSPGKGIETVIEALPAICQSFPDVIYLVLGATHPHILASQGESYREGLQALTTRLGVEGHVRFINRFVPLNELCEFLGAAELYVTPYLGVAQVASGTLAYALGAGNAVISTPYWYAEELLAEGRGVLTPFRDATALAENVLSLLRNPSTLHALRKKAYDYSRSMVWSEVAGSYHRLFSDIKAERSVKPATVSHGSRRPSRLPGVRLVTDHLRALTDATGIFQHACHGVPQRAHGYCTDDNARALQFCLEAPAPLRPELHQEGIRYASFLENAFNPATGRFRNFYSYEGAWTEVTGSEDCHGRSLTALGLAIERGEPRWLSGCATELFHASLPALADFTSLRGLALSSFGLAGYLRRFPGDRHVGRIYRQIAVRLYRHYLDQAVPEWPWPEAIVTYDNGCLPQALLEAGHRLGLADMTAAGLHMLEWLMRVQTTTAGHFAAVGNRGWYPRGSRRPARFDQQPIEAQSCLTACAEAYRITGDAIWHLRAKSCLEWFLGNNDMGQPLADVDTGACRDGLHGEGANQNQGAESTLAWLLSLTTMSRMNRVDSPPPWPQTNGTSTPSDTAEVAKV